MLIDEIVQELLANFGYQLGLDMIAEGEQRLAPAQDAIGVDEASWTRYLDLYGLAAVEGALVASTAGPAREQALDPDDFSLEVTVNGYLAAAERFTCTPLLLPDCLEAPTMSDVIPLRGDYLKVLGGNDAPALTTNPFDYVQFSAALSTSYAAAAGDGQIGGYQELALSPLPAAQAGLWLLRAGTLVSDLDPMGRRQFLAEQAHAYVELNGQRNGEG